MLLKEGRTRFRSRENIRNSPCSPLAARRSDAPDSQFIGAPDPQFLGVPAQRTLDNRSPTPHSLGTDVSNAPYYHSFIPNRSAAVKSPISWDIDSDLTSLVDPDSAPPSPAPHSTSSVAWVIDSSDTYPDGPPLSISGDSEDEILLQNLCLSDQEMSGHENIGSHSECEKRFESDIKISGHENIGSHSKCDKLFESDIKISGQENPKKENMQLNDEDISEEGSLRQRLTSHSKKFRKSQTKMKDNYHKMVESCECESVIIAFFLCDFCVVL